MKQIKSLLLLLLLSVIFHASCTTNVQPGDKTPPTVGMEISINGTVVESDSQLDHVAEYGDEILLVALGQDEQGLMCVEIWLSGYTRTCRVPGSNIACQTQPLIAEPDCESDVKVGDEVPTTLADSQEIKIDSSGCERCGEGAQLSHERTCYFAFAKNFGDGPDEETTSRSALFCYEYTAE